MNLQRIEGTDAESFLLSRGFSPDACQALRFQRSPPTIVCPLVDDSGVPQGAQAWRLQRAPDSLVWRDPNPNRIGARPGLTMRIRSRESGTLVLALGLSEALAYATLSDRAVWGVLPRDDRGAIAIPETVIRVVLASRPAEDLRPEAMAAARALAARGFEAAVEISPSKSWEAVLRWPEGRERARTKWEAEAAGEIQSMTCFPDGRLWTYRKGWSRWDA